MSDRPDRERLEPELGQDLLDILPDRGIGRGDRETLSPRPLPRKKRKGFLLWFLLFFLASGAAVATWWWLVKDTKTASSSVEVPLVKADERSYKSKPSTPGGMDVPDQDKMVYNRMGNADEAAKPPVERLLPPPEAPQAPPSPVAPVSQAIPPAPPPAAFPELPKTPVTEAPKATPPSMRDTAPPDPAPIEPPMTAEKAAKPPKIAAEPKKPAKAETVAVKPAGNGGGAWLVQLGAIKDETAASRQWSQIQKANSDLLGGLSLDVQRADLPKGTFYRLRAGSLDSKEVAKALCQQLEARKQGCIVVHR